MVLVELTECKAKTAGNEFQWKWTSRPEWFLTAGELLGGEKSLMPPYQGVSKPKPLMHAVHRQSPFLLRL